MTEAPAGHLRLSIGLKRDMMGIGIGWRAMAEASSKPVTLSFIVPALNEEDVVEWAVNGIIECLEIRQEDYELILIDDGSIDRTAEILDSLAQRNDRVRTLHNAKNLGLGLSYQRGIEAATKDYVMLLCGDGGLPASSLPLILDQVGKADIVIPYMENLKTIKTPFRFILSRTYSTLLNLLFGLKLHYYNGLPVHRLDLLRKLDITSTGFGFQGEILIKLLKNGHSFVEVGVKGAEENQRSSALRLKNIISVARTLASLVWEIHCYVRRAKPKDRYPPTT
jgi:dolichol-phosphate mannosyltransferase